MNNSGRFLLGILSIAFAMIMNLSEAFVKNMFWPLRYLEVILHEVLHTLMTFVSGGYITHIWIAEGHFDAGVTYTVGGNDYIIIPAGFIGVVILSSLSLYLNNKFRWGKLSLLVLLSIALAVFWVYGIFTMDFWKVATAIIVLIVSILVIRWVSKLQLVWITINIISLYWATSSIVRLAVIAAEGTGNSYSDPANFAFVTRTLDEQGWAGIWLVACLFIVLISFFLSFILPVIQENKAE